MKIWLPDAFSARNGLGFPAEIDILAHGAGQWTFVRRSGVGLVILPGGH